MFNDEREIEITSRGVLNFRSIPSVSPACKLHSSLLNCRAVPASLCRRKAVALLREAIPECSS